jgi:hypothetical protein
MLMLADTFSDVLSFEFVGDGTVVEVLGHVVEDAVYVNPDLRH